jgi:hypothetical protein
MKYNTNNFNIIKNLFYNSRASNKRKIVIYVLIFIAVILMSLNNYSKPKHISSVILPDGIRQVRYRIAKDKSYIPALGSIDVYASSEKELAGLNLVKYDKKFGDVENERTAVDIATIVFSEIYKDCHKKETPFVVKYNEKAEAWIVHGTLPIFSLGGVATIAIKKSGEILMIMHTK